MKKFTNYNKNKISTILVLVTITVITILFILGNNEINSNKYLSPANTFIEKCYNHLEFSETITGDSVTLTLLKSSPIYGLYEGFTPLYFAEDGSNYILEIKNSNSRVKEVYSLTSSLLVYDLRSTQLYNSGTIHAYLPYNPKTNKLTLKNTLGNTLLSQNIQLSPCTQTCIGARQTGYSNKEDRCCLGLIKNFLDSNRFICVRCGDFKCDSQFENTQICPEDCAS